MSARRNKLRGLVAAHGSHHEFELALHVSLLASPDSHDSGGGRANGDGFSTGSGKTGSCDGVEGGGLGFVLSHHFGRSGDRKDGARAVSVRIGALRGEGSPQGQAFGVDCGFHHAGFGEEVHEIGREGAAGAHRMRRAGRGEGMRASGVRAMCMGPAPPWASRMSEVSLRASGSGKLSAMKTILPRVVMSTGPSLVVKSCSTAPSPAGDRAGGKLADAGILAAETVRVDFGEDIGGVVALPDRQIKETDGGGVGLLRRGWWRCATVRPSRGRRSRRE